MKSKLRESEPKLETIHSVCSEETDDKEEAPKKKDEPSGNTFIISNLPSLGGVDDGDSRKTFHTVVSTKTLIQLSSILLALASFVTAVMLLAEHRHTKEQAEVEVRYYYACNCYWAYYDCSFSQLRVIHVLIR
jgi:hypothetical protein